jgi:predicted dehydrogenase
VSRGHVRAALIGAGFWATHAHLPALLRHGGIDLLAIVDPEIERARLLAASNHVPLTFDSMDRLLAVQDVDLVVIAAPTEAHPTLTALALRHGAAVLCEKPLANTVQAAVGMADLAEPLAVPSSVGYSFRYAPPLQALKRDIESGVLGRPWLLEMFEYNAQFHPSRGKATGWKGDPRQARAGALLEYGSHLIDMANWLAGPIEAVHAVTTRVLPGAVLDDIAALQVRFQAPAIGVLVSGWVLSGSIPGIKIRFHGAEGLAEVELSQAIPGGQAYRRASLDGVMKEMPLVALGDPVSGCAARHVSDLVTRMRGEVSVFPDTLPTLRDGVRVQQVLEAALAATGGWMSPADADPTRT